MKYFGILQKEDYASLMSHKITQSVKPERGKVLAMIPDYKKLESLLNYEFRDKALLLQALTHPSCLTNQLTDCYQKLEFIGDAVLGNYLKNYWNMFPSTYFMEIFSISFFGLEQVWNLVPINSE